MSHGYLILMSYVATFGLSLDVQGTYHWTSSSSVNPSPGYPRDISVLLGVAVNCKFMEPFLNNRFVCWPWKEQQFVFFVFNT